MKLGDSLMQCIVQCWAELCLSLARFLGSVLYNVGRTGDDRYACIY